MKSLIAKLNKDEILNWWHVLNVIIRLMILIGGFASIGLLMVLLSMLQKQAIGTYSIVLVNKVFWISIAWTIAWSLVAVLLMLKSNSVIALQQSAGLGAQP